MPIAWQSIIMALNSSYSVFFRSRFGYNKKQLANDLGRAKRFMLNGCAFRL